MKKNSVVGSEVVLASAFSGGREAPHVTWLCPITALEGIHEHMEDLKPWSTVVETLVEAATRVDS